MIHIIFGEEDFLIREKIAEISNNNFKFLSFKEKDFILSFQQEINKKLWENNAFLAIRDFHNGADNELLYALFRNYNPEVIFMFKEKPELFVKTLKQLKIPHKIYAVENTLSAKNKIGRANFKKWAEEVLVKYQVKLHPKIIENLCEIFINSPNQFLAEIKKLSFYKKNQLITNDELKALIRQPNESKVFEMVDYLREKNFNKFFAYLKREIIMMGKSDGDLLLLLGLLGSTIFRILLLKKAQAENRLNEINNMNLYYKNKLLATSYKFSEKELKYIYNIIITLEKRYKKHQIKASDIPEEMLIGMSQIK